MINELKDSIKEQKETFKKSIDEERKMFQIQMEQQKNIPRSNFAIKQTNWRKKKQLEDQKKNYLTVIDQLKEINKNYLIVIDHI